MESRTCPSCGRTVDAGRAGGLCPACLMKEAFETAGPTVARTLRCAACGTGVGPDARFCAQCGAAVPAEPAASGDALRGALEAKLQGQYRIVRLLGRGGMGAVYLARDLALEREVAIKVLKTASAAPEVRDRLRREARTAARLSHPNIVPLHAFGEVEGLPYFVMGYVRGESLAARLRRDGRLPEDEARRVLADVADALDHAHRQGIVHRDVKPDNVLLDDESGRALLTDFGVARALGGGETMTAAGQVVGTPSYMSPEQAAGRPDVDLRSDLYSLGVMGYAMLTGRLPFEGKTAADVLAKHLTQDPPPLRALAATATDATVTAVERCLAKDPAKRWPDARSLRDALGTSAGGPALPEALDRAQSHGLWLALWTFAAALLGQAAWLWRFHLGPGDFALFAILGTVAGAGMVASLRRILAARARGFAWADVRRVALWPSPSWTTWYPRALRRPGDVWDRLPAPARFARVFPALWLGSGFVIGPLAVIGISNEYERWSDPARWLVDAIYVTTMPFAMAAFWGTVIVPAWVVLGLRRRGLPAADGLRIALTEPTARPAFWSEPQVAALLAPADLATAGGQDSPHEQLQSILRNADGLSGPLRALGAQAGVAARQLVVAVEHSDREIAELARTFDGGEEQRLVDKIDALRAAPAESSLSVRELVEKQLELVRALKARLEEARDERNRKIEMLRTLGLHLRTLRARAAEAPAEVPSLSDRVRVLCDEIASQALALAGDSPRGR